ncbi:MAG: SIMPL domain-containing protein [Cyanobacteria bacterium P01_A01_bin.84]
MLAPGLVRAEVLKKSSSTDTNILKSNQTIAQLFYPPVDRKVLRVVGKGIVKIPADNAKIIINFRVNRYNRYPSPSRLPRAYFKMRLSDSLAINTKQASPKKPPTPPKKKNEPLTKDTFKSVIEKLITNGVNRDNIDVFISNQYGRNIARMVINIKKPSRDKVEEIVNLVTEEAKNIDRVSSDRVSVDYSVNECQNGVNLAYESAIKDANNRASALAKTMGLKIGTPSIAEPFFSMFYPSCSSDLTSSFSAFGGYYSRQPYNPEKPAEVEIRKDIFVSFPVK